LAVAGYQGRKRGEVVRSRLVIQQAHTREWLGTFGDAGNGQRWLGLERAWAGVVQYMRGRGLSPDDGLMRMDGEFGWAHAALLLEQGGPGYLMRCSDYRLLSAPQVKAALGHAPQRFAPLDTGTEREVYEAGWVVWSSEIDEGKTVSTRLVVAATPAPDKGEPKVGKRVGAHVYELFVTSVGPEALTASDVLSLYFGRGGFEQTLSEEDREIEPDRWVSGHPAGQELWQILAQWIWNLRLRLGAIAAPCTPRCTLWSEPWPPSTEPASSDIAQATPPGVSTQPASSDIAGATVPGASTEPASSDIARATAPDAVEGPPPASTEVGAALIAAGASEPLVALGEAAACTVSPETAPEATSVPHQRWTPTAPLSTTAPGFILQPDGTLLCPEHKVLRQAEVRRHSVRFQARHADCKACPRATHCLRPNASGRKGRRVDWPIVDLAPVPPPTMPRATPPSMPRATPPARPGQHPVSWIDLPATTLRRTLPSLLAQQHVEGLPVTSAMPLAPRPLSRDQRAHRRLRWDERLARNARPVSAPPIRLKLYGIPLPLAAYLGVPATG
jgi:hypothetical protein